MKSIAQSTALPRLFNSLENALRLVSNCTSFSLTATGTASHQQKNIASLIKFSWGNVTSLLAGFYRQNGYEVEELGKDEVFDLALRRDGKKILVQCRHWQELNADVRMVRKLHRAQFAAKADKAILIIGGNYTGRALEFAEGKPLELVDGAHCVEMARQVQRNLTASGVPLPEPLSQRSEVRRQMTDH